VALPPAPPPPPAPPAPLLEPAGEPGLPSSSLQAASAPRQPSKANIGAIKRFVIMFIAPWRSMFAVVARLEKQRWAILSRRQRAVQRAATAGAPRTSPEQAILASRAEHAPSPQDRLS
jgi:hypothetical protein